MILRWFFYTGIGTFDAFLCGHIVFIRHIAGKICGLERNCLIKIKGFNGFHQFILHLSWAVHRNPLKSNASTPVQHEILCLCIVITAVTPGSLFRRLIADHGVRACIKQPEGHVYAFDFVNMVLILKDLRKQAFSVQMLHQPCLRRLFIQLKRNHIIRTKRPGKLSHQYNRISAVRTGRCRHAFVSHDLSSTGFTLVCTQSACLFVLPFSSCRGIPRHIVTLLLLL